MGKTHRPHDGKRDGVTKNSMFKKMVRSRMAATGEPYTVARRAILAERAETEAAITAPGGGVAPDREDTVKVNIGFGEEFITAKEVHDFTEDEMHQFLRMLLGEEGIPLDEEISRRVGILPIEEEGK